MSSRIALNAVMAITTALLSNAASSEQSFPNKPLRIIAGGVAGASGIAARVLADGLAIRLGQPVIVENRGGNQQLIILNASPDGYTMVVSGSSFWLAPLLEQNITYDPVRDFAPISIVGL